MATPLRNVLTVFQKTPDVASFLSSEIATTDFVGVWNLGKIVVKIQMV